MSTTLDLRLNQVTLLDRLASNLKIPTVNNSSNIKKIADAFEGEMINLTELSKKTLDNSILGRMSEELIEEFAASIGLSRLRYGSIKLNKQEAIASIYIDANNRYDPTLTNVTLFLAGETIYSNDTFTIKTREDIILNNMESIIYPSLDIRLNSNSVADSFTISQFTTLLIQPPESVIIQGIPEVEMLFNYPVGLAYLTEDINDFKNRIYTSLSMSNNIANSLIYSIVNESPILFKLQLENIEEGRSVSVLYPYTRELLEDNDDQRLNSTLIPLINTSLASKYKHNMVYVRAPSPVQISINIARTSAMPTLLDNIRKELNMEYRDNKDVNIKDIKDSIVNKLQGNATNIKVTYGSALINYNGLELTDEEVIELPIGRFLNITNIAKGVSS